MSRVPVSQPDLEVVTEPLGGSPLSVAAQQGAVPDTWYQPRPTDAAEWRARAGAVARGFEGGDWLRALDPAFAPSGEALRRLRRTGTQGGVVVTTGQQPGLFGGPVYTLSKALGVLALADELEAATHIPVAPVFWAATDDADFEEARSTTVVVQAATRRLEMRDAPPPGTPMSHARVGDLRRELADLEQASGSGAFDQALEAARNAYRPGTTIGAAYVTLLRTILEPLGISVLDASHPALRAEGAPVLRDALVHAADVAAALTARTAELKAAGFEPQVADVAELSLVFRSTDGTKRRVPIGDANEALRNSSPDGLSPNVLLRPVLERAVLPTVGYLAGPAELAYFAQVGAVSDVLGAEKPLALPRWSTTIIEPHVRRILQRLNVRHTEFREPHAVEGRLARAAVPRSAAAALEKLRAAVESGAESLESDAAAAGLVPRASVEGARRSLLDRLDRLERRYVAAVKRREEELMRLAATARANLYPDGKRQERALNFIPMLARHGHALLDAMRVAAGVHARALVDSGAFAAGARVEPIPAERGARP